MLPDDKVPSTSRQPLAKLRLTDAAVAGLTLPPDKSDMLVWDAAMNGLALRVGKARRAWVYVYRPVGAGGRRAPQKIGLGAWPAISVTKARQLAQTHAGLVASGKDPAAERREQKRLESSSVEKVLDAYEASLKRRRYANLTTAMSVLRRGLAGLERRDVASLTRRELVERIDAAAVLKTIETPDGDRKSRGPRKRVIGGPGAAADLRTASPMACSTTA